MWAAKTLGYTFNSTNLSETQNYHQQGNNELTGEQRNTEIDQGNYNENIAGNYHD